MTTMANDKKYKISDDTLHRVNEDESVAIMHMDDSDHFFTVNGLAAQIWVSLKEAKTFDQVVGEFRETYENLPEVFERDTSNLINELLSNKLIIEVPVGR